MTLLEELKWRGLVAQTTDEAKVSEALESKQLKVYIGFDPTAPSLHHGNLVQLILLKHIQDHGNTPICVAGGATGLIGDPRQSGERKLNDEQTVAEWLPKLESQFKRFLNFDPKLPNHALVVNNYEWTKGVAILDFLRDIGKHFRVNNMIAKETVAMRLNSKDGISFTEFSYQILQAYDYLMLHQKYGVNMQCGGNDQWGNLTAGLDLIRKVTGDEVSVLTTPIIAKSDGSKFGKSEGGSIWLDPEFMSPYSFYQFWLNTDDSDAVRMLKVFTFLGKDEIDSLEAKLQSEPEAREAQKVLASEVTKFVHGESALEKAIAASNALFAKGDLSALDAETLDMIAKEIGSSDARIGDELGNLFIASGLAASIGEYTRGVNQHGMKLNNQPIGDAKQKLESKDLLANGYALLRKGKKEFKLIKAES